MADAIEGPVVRVRPCRCTTLRQLIALDNNRSLTRSSSVPHEIASTCWTSSKTLSQACKSQPPPTHPQPAPKPRRHLKISSTGCTRSNARCALCVYHTHNSYRNTQLDDIGECEAADAQRCCIRLQHLREVGAPAKEQVLAWNRKRMDRLLADYMLRVGYLQSAASLTSSTGITVCQCSPQRRCVPPTKS